MTAFHATVDGKLLSIEVCEPCRLAMLDKIAGSDRKARAFIRRSSPRELIRGRK